MFNFNHQGEEAFKATVSCTALATVAVILRFFCKIRNKQGVRSDDYWILGALVLYYAANGVMLWGKITGGGGKEMEEMIQMVAQDPSTLVMLEKYLKSMFLSFVFNTACIYSLKMSILFFYRHIFFITKGYRRASLCIMMIETAWYIATGISTFLMCQPLDSFWNRLKVNYCFDFNKFFLATGIVDTLIDVLILALPVRMAFGLQLPIRTKVVVAGIFALGGLAVITNVIRVEAIYQPHSRYVSMASAELWSNIHMVIAFVCACLPIFKPLWTSVSAVVASFFTRYASTLRSKFGSGAEKPKNTSYLRMGRSNTSFKSDVESGYATGEKQTNTITSVMSGKDNELDTLQAPQGSIAYTRQYEVVRVAAA